MIESLKPQSAEESIFKGTLAVREVGSTRRRALAQPIEVGTPVGEDVVPLVPGLVPGAGEIAVREQEAGASRDGSSQ
jgi:hypothetical protein